MKNLTILWTLAIVLVVWAGQADGQYVWTKDVRNPVLSGGGSGAWNKNVGSPCVLFNADSARYEMWFTAFPGIRGDYNDYRPYSIGRAISTDGIHWTMDASPVMTPTAGTWDAHTLENPMVIRDSGAYKMWYTTFLTPTSPCYMGYATSPDGIHWTKYPGNPIMGPGKAAWEAGGPWSFSIMPAYPSGGYRAWYSAVDAGLIRGAIGYATSADGIVWMRDTVNNPVLRETLGQWDDTELGPPQVFHFSGSTYYMWYAAYPNSLPPRNIGLAVSNDGGATWTKYSGNPVLGPSPGTWDGVAIACGTVLHIPGADSVAMWYEGLRSPLFTSCLIGRATSPFLASGVSQSGRTIPTDFKLFQNYPNPFNPSTTIQYALPHRSYVTLAVYNTLGQQVAALVNGEIDAGYHEVTFNAGNLSSGVYFYRMQTGGYTETRKLMLMK